MEVVTIIKQAKLRLDLEEKDIEKLRYEAVYLDSIRTPFLFNLIGNLLVQLNRKMK